MEQKTRKKYIELEAARVCKILEEELAEIRYVKDWAAKAGCSKKKLQRVIKESYGVTAKQKLTEVRKQVIDEIIWADEDVSSYETACRSGLKNEQYLYHFLAHNFNQRIPRWLCLGVKRKV
jgi:AraC-like DNA-binding protein